MSTKTDLSYGVVPVKKDKQGSWLFLLIEQHDRRGGTFWAFPKGHPEPGETAQEAASRELAEEVGLTEVDLEIDQPFTQQYEFMWQGVLIKKTVIYFIGYVSDQTLKLQEREIAAAAWLKGTEAGERLTHQNAKDILQQALHYLNK